MNARNFLGAQLGLIEWDHDPNDAIFEQVTTVLEEGLNVHLCDKFQQSRAGYWNSSVLGGRGGSSVAHGVMVVFTSWVSSGSHFTLLFFRYPFLTIRVFGQLFALSFCKGKKNVKDLLLDLTAKYTSYKVYLILLFKSE